MKLEHSPYVAVQVHDYTQAIAFYRDVMGMELLKTHERETEFECGPLHFFIEDNPEGKVFFEFATDDLEAAKAALTQAGCRLSETHTDEGARSYLVSDPYGMHFHLFQA